MKNTLSSRASEVLGAGLSEVSCAASEVPENYRNPILSGFYPDPSICRVEDTFYLVNSSFEWFPGVPVFRSRDLVNWEQIGHAIDRIGMLKELDIWAPTIRHHEGVFYMVTTELPGQVFFVTATDPAGPWSDPVYVEIDTAKVSAIDPSLYWDDDGTCWFAANDRLRTGTIKHWVWIQKIDLRPVERNGRWEATFRGERKYISEGSGVGPDNYAEGPHIFKTMGKYFLLIAEGGTWDNHAMSVLRTDDLDGPVDNWEKNPANPILTHRDKTSPISATGHADFVDTSKGDWWSVHLGVRKRDGKHRLGRETFLVPLEWVPDGKGSYWPAYNPDSGHQTLMVDRRPDLPWTPVPGVPEREEFDAKQLPLHWNFYNEPKNFDWLSLSDHPGHLRIRLRQEKATDPGNCGFVGRRQQHHNFDVATRFEFTTDKANEVAGLMASIKFSHQMRLELTHREGHRYAILHVVAGKPADPVAELELEGEGPVYFALQARDWDYQFLAGTSENDLRAVGGVQDARILSSEIAEGFTGSYVGLYASSQGVESSAYADYDWFAYKPVEQDQ